MLNTIIEFINNAGSEWWAFSWAMLLQASILIAIIFLLDLFLRKRVRAVVRYWIWMLVLAKLALPTSLALPTGVGYWCGDFIKPVYSQPGTAVPHEAAQNTKQIQIAKSEIENEQAGIMNISHGQDARATENHGRDAHATVLHWQAMVLLGWIAGMAALAIVVIQRMWFVRALVAQSEPANGRLAEAMAECRVKMGLRQQVELRLTKNVLSPAACGLIRPIVLMPESIIENLTTDFTDYTDKSKIGNLKSKITEHKLRAVLTHELVHIKRGDLWLNFAQTVLQIVYFYNPLVWVANAIIRQVREQAVDEATLVNLGDEAKDYGTTLVDIAEMALSRPHFSLRLVGVVESKKSLAGRIKHIMSRPMPKSAKIGVVGFAAVVIIGAILLPMAKAEKNLATEDTEVKKSEALSSKSETNSNDINSKFKTTLANGVTVELLGVCEHPSKDKQWWKPDGSLLDTKPYDYPGCNIKVSQGRYARETAIRISGTLENDFGFRWKLTDAQSSCSGAVMKDGKQVMDMRVLVFDASNEAADANIGIGVAAGLWETIRAVAPAEIKGTRPSGGDGGGIIWNEPIEQGGKTIIAVSHSYKTHQARVVIKGKDDKLYTSGSTSSSVKDFEMIRSEFNMPLADIKEFVFQSRPYEWVEFKNVSLRPGFKTDVKIQQDLTPEATEKKQKSVRLIIGKDKLVLQGKNLNNWEEVGLELVKVPDRPNTVLEAEVAAGVHDGKDWKRIEGVLAALAKEYNFDHLQITYDEPQIHSQPDSDPNKYPPTYIQQPISPSGRITTPSGLESQPDIDVNSLIFEVSAVNFEQLQQGKNILSLTVKNITSSSQHFGIHIYTRSPDYMPGGMGWGTSFGSDFDPSQTQNLRYAYKIQGPLTDKTYIIITFYDSNELDKHAVGFFKKTYFARDLKQWDRFAHSERADEAMTQQILEVFNKIKSAIRAEDYKTAWSFFTEDFKQAEFQRNDYSSFVERMTNPVLSRWHFNRLDFISLVPDSVTATANAYILWAELPDQNEKWRLIFVPSQCGLKLDWIYYTPPLVYLVRAERYFENESAMYLDILYKRLKANLVEGKFPPSLDNLGFNNRESDWFEENIVYLGAGQVSQDQNSVATNIIAYNKNLLNEYGQTVALFSNSTIRTVGPDQLPSTQQQGNDPNTKQWAQNLVEDFFKNNYRDVTSRKTVEWGEPVTDANGNVSISYKYEMVIWDKDKYLANEIFTFDKAGKFVKVEKTAGFPKSLGSVPVSPEDISTKAAVQKLVEKFFTRNYRDITARKTLEWGASVRDANNGNVSIRYKYEATIWDKDKVINDEIFTFDKNGQFVSVKKQ